MIQYDFRKIQSDYPKSLTKLKEWWLNQKPTYSEDYPDDQPAVGLWSNGILYIEYRCPDDGYFKHYLSFNPLELSFFFDEQKEIGVVFYNGGEWFFEIDYGDNLYCYERFFSSRSSALIALYNKQFEILEQRLSTPNGG